MVMAYFRTIEDRFLIEKPYKNYRGKKIDIRWSGGWLTPEGKYLAIDYKNGITHETIAEEYGNQICGSGSIMTRPPIMRIFDIAQWMRITYFEGSSFCVELKGSFVDICLSSSGKNDQELREYNHRRQTQLLKFVNDFKNGFESYFINNTKYNCYRDFAGAIRNNEVKPTDRSQHTT